MVNQVQHNYFLINVRSNLSKVELSIRALSLWFFIATILSITLSSVSVCAFSRDNKDVATFHIANDSTQTSAEDNSPTVEDSTKVSIIPDPYDTLKVSESSYKFDSSWVAIAKPDSAELASLNSDSDLQYGRTLYSDPSNSFWGIVLRWLYSKLGSWSYSESGSLFYNILYYGLIILLCSAFVYYLSKSNFHSIIKGVSKQIEIRHEEFSEDIHEVDIQQLINKYVAEKDFRRAVRYLYLQVLKSLTDARFIDWLPSKTNATYSSELSSNRKELTNDFLLLTRIFNYAWYGNYPLSENDFSDVKSTFSLFQHRIQSAKPISTNSSSVINQPNTKSLDNSQTIEGVQR